VKEGCSVTYKACRGLLRRILDVVEKVLVILGITLFGMVILANALEIFARTVFGYSFFWVQEFTVVICSYTIFLGIVVVFKRKGNIFVTFIYDRFPDSIKRTVSVSIDLMMVVFLIISIKLTYAYLLLVYGGYTQTMKIPYFMMYLPILISLSLILLTVVDWFLDDVERLSLSTRRQ
jgi:TRAP-type C4-dicarboxylate transport system permease small subunit